MKNVLLTSTDRHKKPKELPPVSLSFFPRQAWVAQSQAWAACLILKAGKDRAEVETTLQTGQEVSDSGTGEYTGWRGNKQ